MPRAAGADQLRYGKHMADLSTTLRHQRRQMAMSEIAQVALRLFLDRGFEETNVEAIAAAAGCSPRTFYRYFGTKEDVMFHDIPAMIERLDALLDARLADGSPPWAAITESLVAMVDRFDPSTANSPGLAVERMALWMKVTALRTRYLLYVTAAESTVAERLSSYLESSCDLGPLMAVVAIGAYRATVFTHSLSAPEQLASHLRRSLAIAGAAFATVSAVERTTSVS
jgi:AcrR family transcriptional regulator